MHAHVHMTDPIILWGRDEYTEDQSIYGILCIKDHTYTGTRCLYKGMGTQKDQSMRTQNMQSYVMYKGMRN